MITVYCNWLDIPDGLMTRTQLKAERLKPAPGQKPAARMSGRKGVYDLYEKAHAVPMRQLTEPQQAAALQNIEKAQAALYCIDCHDLARPRHRFINGRCKACHWDHRRRTLALDRLVELSGMNDWLVLDTETTGLSAEAEVISLAVVTSVGEVLFNELVRPSQPIHPRASMVNGITDEMAAGAAAFTEVYPRLAKVLAGRLVLAYNAEFDRRMLRQTCERYDLPVLEVAEWECVMELYAAARNWRGKLSSLHDACVSEGITFERLHEACADAQATRLLLRAVGGKD